MLSRCYFLLSNGMRMFLNNSYSHSMGILLHVYEKLCITLLKKHLSDIQIKYWDVVSFRGNLKAECLTFITSVENSTIIFWTVYFKAMEVREVDNDVCSLFHILVNM